MRTPLATACLLSLVLLTRCSHADGIPFRGNRVDGKTTVIAFTPDQVREGEKQVDVHTWHATFVILSSSQKRSLLRESGVSVDRVELLSVDEAKGDCACFMEDIGIEFEKGKIEIPHAYLAPYRRAGAALSPVQREGPRWIYLGGGVVLAVCIAVVVVVRCTRARRSEVQ